MFILFSPSEEKIKSSNDYSINFIKDFFKNFDDSNLFVKSNFRKVFLQLYANNFDDLETIFGIKDTKSLLECFSPKLYKAINLYNGVSFKELDYDSLNQVEQKYIDDKLLIFSNLFGVVKATDEIPFYKLKQGVKLNKINQAKEYKKDISDFLDTKITDFAIDLRAKIYEEYYEIKIPFYTFEFYKNNKQLSHDSKVYRGKILRQLATHNITNANDLFNMISQNYKVFKTDYLANKTTFYIDIKENLWVFIY